MAKLACAQSNLSEGPVQTPLVQSVMDPTREQHSLPEGPVQSPLAQRVMVDLTHPQHNLPLQRLQQQSEQQAFYRGGAKVGG